MTHEIQADIRFSIIPEWILDSDISDRAVRIYAILARYADSETLQAFPSRETLGRRAGCNVKAVTKSVEELVAIGAVVKQHRKNGEAFQSNLYTLRRVGPNLTLGRVNPDPRVGSNLTLGRVSDDPLTITTQLEPLNNINRATKLDNYKPSEELQEQLTEKYPDLDYDDTLEAFIDHHTAKGSTFKDWDAAVRTWWRNAQKWSEPKTVIHKQEVKGSAEGPGRREWVRKLHLEGEHFECKPGEFGCK
jgi:hypothetical protein